ncbi:hypothetical protein GE061_017455 [Apolygus lucorum]|uniref:Uncharacterized protein n=1 Tax=Apolygus lucorum TaxID=248454 RepID=A0A8S9XDS1_APOLU|nr:hypothetical protein GE061_017455 [Apolygus lucorum]
MDKIVSRRKFVRAFFTKLASKITEPGPEGDVTEFRVKMDSLKEKCQLLADLDAAVFESLVSADVEPEENEVIEELEVAQSYQDRYKAILLKYKSYLVDRDAQSVHSCHSYRTGLDLSPKVTKKTTVRALIDTGLQHSYIREHLGVQQGFEPTRTVSDAHALFGGDKLRTHTEVFKDWQQEGIIEKIFRDDWDKDNYLPHRPVFKEESTTRTRPVVDASVKENGSPSLKACLDKVINVLEFIQPPLQRFRLHRTGIVSDIRRTFLQMSRTHVTEDERNLFRFLWIDEYSIKFMWRKKTQFVKKSRARGVPFTILQDGAMKYNNKHCLTKRRGVL